MYDNLIADAESFKTLVNRYRTQPYDPKPEWFEDLHFEFCSNGEYAYNSKFEYLLLDKYYCDQEAKHNPTYDPTEREHIMNELVAEFKRIHNDADHATDTILLLLDEIINSLQSNEPEQADSLAHQIIGQTWSYEYLCGICEEFATIVHGNGERWLTHFYDGSDKFYGNLEEGLDGESCNIVRKWVKRFRDDLKKLFDK